MVTGMLLRVIPRGVRALVTVGISPDGGRTATLDDQDGIAIWRVHPDRFALTAAAQTMIDYAQLLVPTDLVDAQSEKIGTAAGDRNDFASWVGRLADATEASCDVALSEPGAPSRPVAAAEDRSNADETVAACEQAIARRPDEPRLHHLLGRALEAAGRQDPAAAEYRKAAEAGYAAAAYRLGQMYLAGEGALEKSQANAAIWFGRAAQAGHADAAAEIALMNFRQARSAQEREAALKLVAAAADRGSAVAHTFLARQAQTADEPQWSQALFHMLVTYRLSAPTDMETAKWEFENGIAAAARQLSAAEAVAVAAKARGWSVAGSGARTSAAVRQ
jgi:hypothetical protein